MTELERRECSDLFYYKICSRFGITDDNSKSVRDILLYAIMLMDPNGKTDFQDTITNRLINSLQSLDSVEKKFDSAMQFLQSIETENSLYYNRVSTREASILLHSIEKGIPPEYAWSWCAYHDGKIMKNGNGYSLFWDEELFDNNVYDTPEDALDACQQMCKRIWRKIVMDLSVKEDDIKKEEGQ